MLQNLQGNMEIYFYTIIFHLQAIIFCLLKVHNVFSGLRSCFDINFNQTFYRRRLLLMILPEASLGTHLP